MTRLENKTLILLCLLVGLTAACGPSGGGGGGGGSAGAAGGDEVAEMDGTAGALDLLSPGGDGDGDAGDGDAGDGDDDGDVMPNDVVDPGDGDAGDGDAGDAGDGDGIFIPGDLLVPTCADGEVKNEEGVCVSVCEGVACGAGSCEVDMDFAPFCICDDGYDGDACEMCAVGYRDVDEMKGSVTCGLDEPAPSDLVLWLDGADSDTIVSSKTGAVTQWASRGAEDALLVPNLHSSTYPAVEVEKRSDGGINFDGVNDRLSGQVNLASGTYTIMMVARVAEVVGTQTLLSAVDGNDDHGLFIRADSNGKRIRVTHENFDGSASDEVIADLDMTTPTLIEINRMFGFVPMLNVRVGEDYEAVAATTEPFGKSLYTRLGLRADTATMPLDGTIYEVLVFSSSLTAEERQQVRDYLTAKWAL